MIYHGNGFPWQLRWNMDDHPARTSGLTSRDSLEWKPTCDWYQKLISIVSLKKILLVSASCFLQALLFNGNLAVTLWDLFIRERSGITNGRYNEIPQQAVESGWWWVWPDLESSGSQKVFEITNQYTWILHLPFIVRWCSAFGDAVSNDLSMPKWEKTHRMLDRISVDRLTAWYLLKDGLYPSIDILLGCLYDYIHSMYLYR